MSDELEPSLPTLPRWAQALAAILLFSGVIGGAVMLNHAGSASGQDGEKKLRKEQSPGALVLTERQLASITTATVEQWEFRDQVTTEGKIVVDEDRSTPIFSPYAGRVIKLLAKPGDQIQPGQPLFTVEATDMVQAQNEYIAAVNAVSTQKSKLNLAQIVEQRQRNLFEARAIALKEWQQGQNELIAAQNELRTADIVLEAARNRLRILGKTDEEINALPQKGSISPETVIKAPIGGTVVQRKVGPGQYVSNSSGDPAFTIGDLSRVWLIAHVRETDAPKVAVGQKVRFWVLAYPDRTFSGPITYIAASVDPSTRRLLVRAEIENPENLLKPEMFASVAVAIGATQASPAVPRDAVIYEGDEVRLWVLRPDNSVELRRIRPGLVRGSMLQVLNGVSLGERIIIKGSLFIDRVANPEG